ncbi:MAG: hypothetical protein AMXMBFR13_45780 [Phycisphaerae bacterium]
MLSLHPALPPVLLQDDAPSLLDRIPLPEPYRTWAIWAFLALVALLILQRAGRGLSRAIRRRRAPMIHPKLQKYNIDHAELDRQRRELAAGIVATSTGSRLAGFRIVRQVEAVFVEGYRTPEDAVIALKAAAAERGANAILNVHTDRSVAGRCTASGDAIVVAPLVAKTPNQRPTSPPPPPPE